ncbi:hypothetical protein E3P99_00054 [Wallemia hederae]|uniref:Uncharacterized protein n=1 Tax=Wallemia hederae TaxID=1540922 RepID=A0A4T0FXY8_9BASI|nr:hypothetical protein E3P99_00054 [Wallemia hederae]
MPSGHKTFDDDDLVDVADAEIDAFTPAVKPTNEAQDSESSDDDDDDDAPVEAVSTKMRTEDQQRLEKEYSEREKNKQRKLKNQRQAIKKQLKEEATKASTSQAQESDDSEDSDEELPDRLPTDIFEQAAQYVPRSKSNSAQDKSEERRTKPKKSRKEQIVGNKLIKVAQSSVGSNRADGLLGDGTGNHVNKYNKNILNRKRKNIRKPAHITHAHFVGGFKPATNFSRSN